MGMYPAGPEALVGQTVGDFRLDRLLGVGATGAVFLAEARGSEPAPARGSAVKLLIEPWQLSADERREFRARFLREAATLRRLAHPHILPLEAYGEANGFAYIAMPFMAGGTLERRLRRADGPIPFNAIATSLWQLAEAIDYAHVQGVVHRDIKPANILVDERGTLYLADFGLVRLLEAPHTRLTVTGQALGTPAYMAPEQCRGDAVGPAADIYSLGVVLYRMVTGREPFAGESYGDLAAQHLLEAPPPPSARRQDLPAAAEAAVLRALEKSPDHRWPTAAALARAFDDGLRDPRPAHLAMAAPSAPLPGAPPLSAPLPGAMPLPGAAPLSARHATRAPSADDPRRALAARSRRPRTFALLGGALALLLLATLAGGIIAFRSGGFTVRGATGALTAPTAPTATTASTASPMATHSPASGSPTVAPTSGPTSTVGTGAGPAPVAAFSWQTGSSNSLQVGFNGAASTGQGLSYAWSYGDGGAAASAGATPTHTYAAAGTYDVALTVTDTYGRHGAITRAVSVIGAPPVAAFTWTKDASYPLKLHFDASTSTGDQPLTYVWTFIGDYGGTATGEYATHTYHLSGPYTVDLTVTDAEGRSATASRQVNAGITG